MSINKYKKIMDITPFNEADYNNCFVLLSEQEILYIEK